MNAARSRPAIGVRRRRFVLSRPLDAPDGFGGTLRRYVEGPVLWGAIAPLSESERLRGGRSDVVATHRITLRARSGIAPPMRLSAGSRRFAIRSVGDPDEGGRDLVCEVEEIVEEAAPMSATSPLLALRGAMLAHLSADAALADLMGGSVRLYDEPPRGAVPVYALLGPAEIRDESVDGALRHGHSHALIVLAKPGSARTALDAAERMAELLSDPALTLDGHVLVTCRVRSLSASRDERSGEARATLTIEAITEAA